MTVLGKMTQQERIDLLKLMGRKGALEDLFVALGRQSEVGINASTSQLYDKIVIDMQQVKEELSSWWRRTASDHSWQYKTTDIWNVNFDSDEVFLA